MNLRKWSNFRTALFNCLMHTCLLFCSFTNITSRNCCLEDCWNKQQRYIKTVACVLYNCIQCMETIYIYCYNLQEAYSWSKAFDSYQTNCASSYEGREAKCSLGISGSSMPRTFENDLRPTDLKFQTVNFSSFQAETTWQKQKDVGGDAVRRRPCLHLVWREYLHSGGSCQHAEWQTACTWCRALIWR